MATGDARCHPGTNDRSLLRGRGNSFEMPRRESFLSGRRYWSSCLGRPSGEKANFRYEEGYSTPNSASAMLSDPPSMPRAISTPTANPERKTRMNETFHIRFREVHPRHDAIPYTKEALERDLNRVHQAWDDCQTDRRRDAIYGYLKAVYDLANWWSAEGAEVHRMRQALRLKGLVLGRPEDVYAAIIRCTADPARADRRTRSKWSRVLRYVKMEKDDKEPLADFVKRKGGINECNARYGRCLRRLASRRRSIAEFQRRAARVVVRRIV